MSILITGKFGQLGQSLEKVFKKENEIFSSFGREELDITNLSEVKAVIEKVMPSTIINTAAYTNVEKAELEPNVCESVNKGGVSNLCNVCEVFDINLIHISTDYVFDGKVSKPYKEDDKENPLNIYGKSKFAGENKIRSSSINSRIIRTSWLYSEYGNNFVKKIINLARKKSKITVVDDQFGCPTYAGDLASAILKVKLHMTDIKKNETYNYSGSPGCSWFEFAEEVISLSMKYDLIKVKPMLVPIQTEQLKSKLLRPKNTILDSNAFCKRFSYKIPIWKKSLEVAIKKMAK